MRNNAVRIFSSSALYFYTSARIALTAAPAAALAYTGFERHHFAGKVMRTLDTLRRARSRDGKVSYSAPPTGSNLNGR